jgi:hypothetical protein
MKLTELLLEGMYNKLVGEINKDIFKTIKAAMVSSGTQQKPKKYKGYQVRKEPITKLGDMFNSERKTLYVGEYSDSVSGLDVEVELKFAVTEEGVREGQFYIDGSAEADDEFPTIEVQIAIHPNDGETIFSKIQPVLRDLVRHEIEHQTHSSKSLNLKGSKQKRGDISQRVKIRKNPDIYYKYYLLPKEVDANIHGLYSKAKTLKQPYQKVVDNYLDSLVDDGIILPNHRMVIYKKWKERIPKIGGIPTLK